MDYRSSGSQRILLTRGRQEVLGQFWAMFDLNWEAARQLQSQWSLPGTIRLHDWHSLRMSLCDVMPRAFSLMYIWDFVWEMRRRSPRDEVVVQQEHAPSVSLTCNVSRQTLGWAKHPTWSESSIQLRWGKLEQPAEPTLLRSWGDIILNPVLLCRSRSRSERQKRETLCGLSFLPCKVPFLSWPNVEQPSSRRALFDSTAPRSWNVSKIWKISEEHKSKLKSHSQPFVS